MVTSELHKGRDATCSDSCGRLPGAYACCSNTALVKNQHAAQKVVSCPHAHHGMAFSADDPKHFYVYI